MTEQEVIELGEFAEELMRDERFNALTQQFELQNYQHLMTTEPHETKKRESIYATNRGLADFLSHLVAVVEQKRKLIAERNAPSPSEDAQDEDVN